MSNNTTIFSNIVKEDKLRDIQLTTMNILKDAVSKTFGPYGSNTIIGKDNGLSRYTKDGHTVLSSLQFVDPIAKAVHSDIMEETLTQAKKIGDSTTSITILSALIFEQLTKYMSTSDAKPATIVRDFKRVANMISDRIRANGRTATIKDMYDIALIATNGDEELASKLTSVYEEYGLDVYIDVKASMSGKTYLKEINGMTMDCGFLDPVLINDPIKNTVEIRKPEIYAFSDPIDTAEMGMFLDIILVNNILKPLKEQKPENIVPTIIMTPRISRDYSAYMDTLMQSIAATPTVNRGLLNIITDIQACDKDQYEDICDFCGCKYIKKYIDPEVQKQEIEAGRAATMENIKSFAGTAELVSSDAYKTTFVNPANMYKADGVTYTDLFNQRIDYIQGQIDKLTVEGNTTTEIYNFKKRLNSLKGKMVEIYIGGVSVADRDADRDLLEDAVLNCRSAALNGVGYAANFEGCKASMEVLDDMTEINDEYQYASIIKSAYQHIMCMLYDTMGKGTGEQYVIGAFEHDCPYNMITEKYDSKVLTSIDTDICILDTISKIITIMVTANQFLLPTVNVNKY